MNLQLKTYNFVRNITEKKKYKQQELVKLFGTFLSVALLPEIRTRAATSYLNYLLLLGPGCDRDDDVIRIFNELIYYEFLKSVDLCCFSNTFTFGAFWTA